MAFWKKKGNAEEISREKIKRGIEKLRLREEYTQRKELAKNVKSNHGWVAEDKNPIRAFDDNLEHIEISSYTPDAVEKQVTLNLTKVDYNLRNNNYRAALEGLEDAYSDLHYQNSHIHLGSKADKYFNAVEKRAERLASKITQKGKGYSNVAERALGLAEEVKGRKYPKDSRLKRLLERGVVTAVFCVGGLFFLSSNITGNAIADLSTKTSSLIGAVLLVVGLVAGFFLFRSRKH